MSQRIGILFAAIFAILAFAVPAEAQEPELTCTTVLSRDINGNLIIEVDANFAFDQLQVNYWPEGEVVDFFVDGPNSQLRHIVDSIWTNIPTELPITYSDLAVFIAEVYGVQGQFLYSEDAQSYGFSSAWSFSAEAWDVTPATGMESIYILRSPTAFRLGEVTVATEATGETRANLQDITLVYVSLNGTRNGATCELIR